MNATPEHALFDQAKTALEREAGVHVCVTAGVIKTKDVGVDYLIKFRGQEKVLAVEVKKWANHASLGALINQVRQLPMEGVLVADYINPKMALKLKEENVQFFDTAGNAYINQPPLYVLIRGNKPDQPMFKKKQVNRVFDATGLKVIFGFLCNDNLLNKPYRDIAKQTKVALGTVGRVINGLKDAGFLLEYGQGKTRRLINKRKLLDRWVEAFPEKLQPKLLLGVYKHEDYQWWQTGDLKKIDALWGGEIAAAKYTEYLKPMVATVFLNEDQKINLIKEFRLGKVTDPDQNEPGLVKLYKIFWNVTAEYTGIYHDLVHPILVYAELLASGDGRNIKTTEKIYEQFIDRYLREN